MILPYKYLIDKKHGKEEARIAPDPIRSNHYQIIDKNGNQTGCHKTG